MPYLRDTVFVLSKSPFREQDRAYIVYGREHGLLYAVARSASSKKSKQAPHLEPLTVSHIMIAKGATFDKLAVAHAEPRSWYAHTHPRLAHYAIALGFTGLAQKLLYPGVADENIFNLFCELCEITGNLPQEPSLERSRFIFSAATVKLLDMLGYAPAPHPAYPVIAFMQKSPLRDCLRITATTHELDRASSFVDEALTHTPLQDDSASKHMILF